MFINVIIQRLLSVIDFRKLTLKLFHITILQNQQKYLYLPRRVLDTENNLNSEFTREQKTRLLNA